VLAGRGDDAAAAADHHVARRRTGTVKGCRHREQRVVVRCRRRLVIPVICSVRDSAGSEHVPPELARTMSTDEPLDAADEYVQSAAANPAPVPPSPWGPRTAGNVTSISSPAARWVEVVKSTVQWSRDARAVRTARKTHGIHAVAVPVIVTLDGFGTAVVSALSTPRTTCWCRHFRRVW